jgi:hypothetical protein
VQGVSIQGGVAASPSMQRAANGASLHHDLEQDPNNGNMMKSSSSEGSESWCEATSLWGLMSQALASVLPSLTARRPVVVLGTCGLPARLLPRQLLDSFAQPGSRSASGGVVEWRPPPAAAAAEALRRAATRVATTHMAPALARAASAAIDTTVEPSAVSGLLHTTPAGGAAVPTFPTDLHESPRVAEPSTALPSPAILPTAAAASGLAMQSYVARGLPLPPQVCASLSAAEAEQAATVVAAIRVSTRACLVRVISLLVCQPVHALHMCAGRRADNDFLRWQCLLLIRCTHTRAIHRHA